MNERQLIEKLNELDQLVEEAKRQHNSGELKRSKAGYVPAGFGVYAMRKQMS